MGNDVVLCASLGFLPLEGRICVRRGMFGMKEAKLCNGCGGEDGACAESVPKNNVTMRALAWAFDTAYKSGRRRLQRISSCV